MPDLFRGIGFPFRRGPTSFPAAATGAALIKDSIRTLVMTRRGDRVMRPDVGSGAYDYIFESDDPMLAETIRTDVSQTLGRYEPRIIVQSVDVVPDADKGTVDVTINYVIRATGTPDSVTTTFTR